LKKTDPSFTVFRVLFEIISAYGTVGLSLGYPTVLTSFSTVWTTQSKLVLCAIMMLGRHRGLPDSVDRAVQLPKDLEILINLKPAATTESSPSPPNPNSKEEDGIALTELSRQEADPTHKD
jgi:hypothetical protein